MRLEENSASSPVSNATWVVVPAYNEGARLPCVLEELTAAGYSVVVVDDGSTDDTAACCRRQRVSYLRHAENLGQGAALRTGMQYALARGADILVTFDADGQHCADEIADMLRPIEEGRALVTLGSRFLGRNAEGMPPTRALALRSAAAAQRWFAGIPLTDFHNGFRAFHASVCQPLTLHQPRMAHATEFVTRLADSGIPFAEVPVTIRYPRGQKRSQPLLRGGLTILRDQLLEAGRRSRLLNEADGRTIGGALGLVALLCSTLLCHQGAALLPTILPPAAALVTATALLVFRRSLEQDDRRRLRQRAVERLALVSPTEPPRRPHGG